MPAIARARILPDRLTPDWLKKTFVRAAITLVELTLALALAAIVIFVAVRVYANGQENERVQALSQELATVKSVIDSRWGTVGDYSQVSADAIAPSLPPTMAQPSSAGYAPTPISNPFRGGVYSYGMSTTSYTIEADLISKGACPRLVNLFSDIKDLTAIDIYDTSGQSQVGHFDVAGSGRPSPAEIANVCGDAGLVTADIVWSFGYDSGSGGGGGSGPVDCSNPMNQSAPACIGVQP